MFVGTKDFIALLGKPIQTLRKTKPATVRSLDILELRPGRPFIVDPYTEAFDFWEVHCSAKGFIYNQVSLFTRIAATKIKKNTLN